MASLFVLTVWLGVLGADPQPAVATGAAGSQARTASATASKKAATAKAKAVRPAFAVIQKTVEETLAKVPNYASGRVLVRSEVEPVFKQLARIGWPVPQAGSLLDRVPSESEELIVALRTPEGRKFMDQIARFPLAYDRLDRWSKLSGGMREIKATIHGPDGYKLIEYLTTASGGKNMGQMLSKAPGGADFNRPTGRIYTADHLVARLRQLYDEQDKK